MKRNKIKYDLIITLIIIVACVCTGCGKKPENELVKPVIVPVSNAETDTTVEVNTQELHVWSTESSDDLEADPFLEDSDGEGIDSDLFDTNSVSIIMVGDMLIHDRIEEVAMNEDGSYDYSAIFLNTRELIEEADIAIANEEVIIGGSELGVSGYPAFNAPFELADDLVEAGFDVICHGTNHALDKGGRGIINCLNNWQEKYPDIAVLGIHDSAQDQQEVYICEKNGIKIAILNYTYGTNGISLPADMPYGVNYLSEDKVRSDLAYAENNADFTIVCPHWGTEYSLLPDAYQKKWANIFVENGADLIIGTHPHVIERIDWISLEDKDNAALCYYSLGNFVNWTSGTGQGVANRMVGAMARVNIKRTGDSNVKIDEYDVVPLISHVTSKEDGVTVYALEDYTEVLASENEILTQAPDFSLEYCNELAGEIFGDSIIKK